jgi:signal transduction histidine kinase
MNRQVRPTRGPANTGGPHRRGGFGVPPEPPRTPGAAVLGETLDRVYRRSAEWAPDALNAEEALAQLEWIRRAVVDGADLAELDGWSAGDRTLIRHLVDLVRADLLEREGPLTADQLLALARRLEEIRTHLAPPPQQILATRLMGADAPELVVELAHDIRSPMTSIMFLAETLRRGQSGQVNDVQRQQLGIIYSAALSLTNIASDLIDLGCEDVFADREVPRSPLSLRELFENVRSMVAPMAEEKRLDILTLTPDHDQRLGNSVSLGRVILNLTTNGIKFTETGCVEIMAQETSPRRVEFSVRDTGRGIGADGIDRLYAPFHRRQSRTGFHFSGSGLGLTICRRMVELMGGTLEVETRSGWGTRFFFELEMPRARRI